MLVHRTIQSSSFSPNASRKTDIKPTITYSSHKSWLKILTVDYWSEDSGNILKIYNYSHEHANHFFPQDCLNAGAFKPNEIQIIRAVVKLPPLNPVLD